MLRTLLPASIASLAILGAALCAGLAVPALPFPNLIILGAGAAAYMALNVGANDVANNMGPTVGARALKLGQALVIAALFDMAGALYAGQSVIGTISTDLLVRDAGLSGQSLVLVMIAALLAGALWINGSTFFGTPVSTTHALIGGIVGAALAAAGTSAVQWHTVGIIAISWTVSPIIGGVLAAALHGFIRNRITTQQDKIAAARVWVPILIAATCSIFAMYLAILNHHATAEWGGMLAIGAVTAVLAWGFAVRWVRERSKTLQNRKKQIGLLFRPALIGAAAMLSFAHGANDVSNAVAPLVVVYTTLSTMPAGTASAIPLWMMAIGAIGIGLGIVLFGPRVIHTVGEQITRLNEIRAFCVALSASITVLAASVFGLPVSSTHVAVGAVLGVGFLREYLEVRNMQGAAVPLEARLVDAGTLNATPRQAISRERRNERRFLVRRLKALRIGAAWLVTLPASALLAAILYGLLSLAFG